MKQQEAFDLLEQNDFYFIGVKEGYWLPPFYKKPSVKTKSRLRFRIKGTPFFASLGVGTLTFSRKRGKRNYPQEILAKLYIAHTELLKDFLEYVWPIIMTEELNETPYPPWGNYYKYDAFLKKYINKGTNQREKDHFKWRRLLRRA